MSDADSALLKTLAERGSRYGNFTQHADITQELKQVMKRRIGWASLSPDKKEALEVIVHKIGRILNGDPEYKDNWHDIAGYAKLAEDRCREPQDTANTLVGAAGCAKVAERDAPNYSKAQEASNAQQVQSPSQVNASSGPQPEVCQKGRRSYDRR